MVGQSRKVGRMGEQRLGGSSGRLVGRIAGGLAACIALMVTGCEWDSYLDPSVVGRWENTPTVAPILERIEVIERDEGEFVEVTQVRPDDLVPVVEDYVLGPGDLLNIQIFDFIAQGQVAPFELEVDNAGTITVPSLGRVPVQGLTVEQIRDKIGAEVVRAGIMNEPPVISVSATGRRQSTFSVFGTIPGPGRYFIPEPEYRLLEALTEAGGAPPTVRKVQVIRQVPLTEVEGVSPVETKQNFEPIRDGRRLTDLIDEVVGEGDDGGGMGSMSQESESAIARAEQPAPPIDLIEPEEAERTARAAGAGTEDGPRWMFLNGRWVQVTRGRAGGDSALPEGAMPLEGGGDGLALVTQRIIEIPTGPLLKGVAKYNIIIRPGDVISVPGPEQGLVYLGGPGISRGGVYNLPQVGRLTLKQAITSAGGLSPVGIPERVDLTRRIGDDREATIRLNLRAIFEGTQPDVFLKPEDQINVGTNFWATPLAVARNGFRTSYGFGFLLDRNFGNDVFGAPPTNRQN